MHVYRTQDIATNNLLAVSWRFKDTRNQPVYKEEVKYSDTNLQVKLNI